MYSYLTVPYSSCAGLVIPKINQSFRGMLRNQNYIFGSWFQTGVFCSVDSAYIIKVFKLSAGREGGGLYFILRFNLSFLYLISYPMLQIKHLHQ